MKYKFIFIVILTFGSISSVCAQKAFPDTAKYTAAEKECRQAINKENWKIAEPLCKNALNLAGQLEEQNKSEKMRAYENYGFTLFSQYKFQAALDNYTKAFEIGKTFLTENDGDLAYAYLNLGRSNQGLAKLDKAQEYYQKSEKIYRSAYEKAKDAEMKTTLKNSVKRTLVLQRYLATLSNDENSIKEIDKKIADLDEKNK